MTATVIEITLTALVLLGVLYEEKLIKLEEKIQDWLAQKIANIIIRRRAAEIAEKRRSKMHVVKKPQQNSASYRHIA